ncbi:hypothetical protein WA1_27590 [Scytonema hofmannii PCC 7110]|uniref:Uncharacterized protein n=1 Tax=Scytonema hofmannii PCC 7110 TaxID=128403 RepID=A0A139X6J1_9CYAN|nr:hypothetical protein [Scytonema hofmannii]KYC40296.1 hypothetical protein WA1_27590 [Scytonema hofmannii PCC 7110]
MVRKLTIAIAAILALAIASCSSEGTQESTNPTPPDAPATTNPANQAATPPVPSKGAKPAFSNPVVAAKPPSPNVSTSANLIQPTNGLQRQSLVDTGRNDPFEQITGSYPGMGSNPGVIGRIRAVPTLPPLRSGKIPQRGSTGKSRVQTNSAKRNLLKNQQKRKSSAIAILPKKKLKPPTARVLPKVLPQVVPNPGLTAMAPPPPQPELARAVVVTGVVLIGREPQAIIKVPNEPTSRYVQAGQRLANGVLIKRIEMNEGSEPIVILEQYGIEVARMVGEGADKDKQAPTASIGSPMS